MAFNNQKTPLAFSLEIAAQRKVQDAIALTGRSLPAQVVSVDGTGTIVTVKLLVQTNLFTLPNVQCPVATSQFARAPIGPGVQGVVWSMDTYIGGVSGLGGGNADLSLPGNLSALIFIPVGNTGFSPTDDPNAYVLYGPDGVILRDSQSLIKLRLQPALAVLDLPPGVPLVINGNVVISGGLALGGPITAQDGHSIYADDIKTAGNVVAGDGTGDQVDLLNHTHKYNNPDGASTVEETESPTAGT
jgi:hypothetical protein